MSAMADRGPERGVRPPVPVPTLDEMEEEHRLHALHSLGVLDGDPRPELETIVRLAARVSGAPAASVNLIDEDRQVPAALHGHDAFEVPRGDSMCTHVLAAGEDLLYTDRADEHELFHDNPHVTGRLGRVRTYAAAVIRSQDGHAYGTLCVFSDDSLAISDQQLASLADLAESARSLLELDRRAARLARLATIDPLTNVVNRRGFEDVVDRVVASARRGRLRPAALVFDLDGFKAVNDTLGHGAGDVLLQLVAGRLVSACRSEDVVARLGGDEFVVLVPSTDAAALEATRRRLLDALRAPTVIAGTTLTPAASCGVALWQAGTAGAADLLARADADMYREKQLARGA